MAQWRLVILLALLLAAAGLLLSQAGAEARPAPDAVQPNGTATPSSMAMLTRGSVLLAAPAAAGEIIWTRQFGSSSSDYAFGVAVDGSGNVYITGSTYGTLPGQTSAGAGDAFVRKYDSNGNELWTRQFGGSSYDEAYGVAVDGSGNVYVAGLTTGTLPGQTSAGLTDAFVRKYDASGNELWTRQFGGSSYDYANDVAVDGSGNVYVGGITFGALPGQTSAGAWDAFVAKLSGMNRVFVPVVFKSLAGGW